MPENVQKLLIYWSLAVAIFVIFIASIYVAALDIGQELVEAGRKRAQQLRGKLGKKAAPDPLAGKNVAGTILPVQELTQKRQWVQDVVSGAARGLGLDVRVLTLQDSKEHYLVHFSDGARLLTYRVDRDWVEAAINGDQEKLAKIKDVVEEYLRVQWKGEKPKPKPAAPSAAEKPEEKQAEVEGTTEA
ncbi:MAG: hypothetical protein HY660_13580 [Armatimonadetes bacterium]|nr:hypothetical protein [Armatimonadota bacterium]